MPTNESTESESSELEVVMGNKQLLSVFFIVVVLLGAFFTMGYVVGRNSVPLDNGAAARADGYTRGSAPSAMPSSTSSEASGTSEATPPATESSETPSAESGRSIETGSSSTSQPREAAVSSAGVIDPEPGRTYVQVLAVAKPQADVLAEVLAKKGFKAFVSPGPTDKQYRVLVGPASDIDHASKLKSDLEAAGFKPFVKKF